MKTRFVNSLQTRVTLVLLVVSLAPLGVVSGFALRTADKVITEIVTSELENVAAEKQELLERWIAERRADLDVVAGSAAIGSMDAAQIAPYLTLLQREYGVYDRFVVAAASGRVVYDSSPASGGEVLSQPWFQQGMAGKPYMSEVRLEAGSRDSVFHLSVPIAQEAKQPQGVVCATVGTRAILSRVLRVSLGATGECYLVDEKGAFLAHKQPERILRQNIAQSESFAYIFGDRRPRPIYTDYRGIEVLGASRGVAGTRWYVVVEQDRDEAFAGASRLRGRITLVIAVTVAAAIGLSWLLADYITAPIRRLGQAARGLARGDYEEAVRNARTTRRDEIGALAAAFLQMADQLHDRQDSLETRVGLTEAELHKVEAKLKGTLEAAAQSERLAALGRLAAGVAHEVRTPLTSLKLFLQSVAAEVDLSPEQGEDYQIAMRQVGRIEATINHFLDFARPREPVLAPLDFPALLANTLEVVRPRANQQKVAVRSRFAPGLPPVEGDMAQLGDALINLMVNALEAMAGGGELAISVEPEPPGAATPGVRIDVSDTGPGIRPEDLDRLFEPFFTTKATGSGLGLAIVRGTVERHGGAVRVDTQLGAGTTFSIRLPASAERRTADDE